MLKEKGQSWMNKKISGLGLAQWTFFSAGTKEEAKMQEKSAENNVSRRRRIQ
jgi:hypothetical protein